MSLTSVAKRQAGVSTAPPGYTGYTMQGGTCNDKPAKPPPSSYNADSRCLDALKECKNGGKWTTTDTLGYCDNQLCTSCSGAWKSCTDDVATTWFALPEQNTGNSRHSLLTSIVLAATSAGLTPCCNPPAPAWLLLSSDAAQMFTLSIAKLEVCFSPAIPGVPSFNE
jgi:hypothetical protein